MKNYNQFLNEDFDDEFTVQDYLKQVNNGDYEELTQDLFDFIAEEGWLASLEDELEEGEEYFLEDFEYLKLNLSEKDKIGLIDEDEKTLEKFSVFDLELKKQGEFPYDTLDFIDYDKGIVYIIRLI